mgnify:FL=1
MAKKIKAYTGVGAGTFDLSKKPIYDDPIAVTIVQHDDENGEPVFTLTEVKIILKRYAQKAEGETGKWVSFDLDSQQFFESGEKVIYLPENKVYDFGYYGQTGKAIIYNEGERSMQDSYAVDPSNLAKA